MLSAGLCLVAGVSLISACCLPFAAIISYSLLVFSYSLFKALVDTQLSLLPVCRTMLYHRMLPTVLATIRFFSFHTFRQFIFAAPIRCALLARDCYPLLTVSYAPFAPHCYGFQELAVRIWLLASRFFVSNSQLTISIKVVGLVFQWLPYILALLKIISEVPWNLIY